jgi:glycosyltransferase involved in cell wall biosynthesis
MNILFVSPYTPTPIRTRPYNLIRALSRRGHCVTLAALWENPGELQILREWASSGIRVISAPLTRVGSGLNLARAFVSGKPLQSQYCWQSSLAHQIVSLLEDPQSNFDLVHVEHLRGAQYGLEIKRGMSRANGHNQAVARPIPIVWDSVDCISHLFEQAAHTSRNPFGRFVTQLELPRTRQYEAWLVKQFSRVLVTSEQDKRAFVDLTRTFNFNRESPPEIENDIVVLHNGVDLEHSAWPDVQRDSRTIILTGKMSYHVNVTAALFLVSEIMPRVWQQRPDVRVQIVGHKPARQVRMLAEQFSNRVFVTGTVPDLRPYLRRATVAAAPILYGAGIQNKVLEAMAAETAVVATSKAVAALSVCNEEQLVLGDTADEFASQLLRLLEDASLRERIARNGRQYVELNHDWNLIVGKLEEIYATVI